MSSVQSILNTASQYLGTQNYNNYCQAFVEQATQGRTGLYPSAISAWQAQQKQAIQGVQGIQPGDTVYFAPDSSNGGYGHTGVYTGNGKFISATYNGVKETDLGQWLQSTGQKLLGYVPSTGEGRGIVQSATMHGTMINNQMQLASKTPDDQIVKLQQQFDQQKKLLQSQQLVQQPTQIPQFTPQPSQQTQEPAVPAVTPSETTIPSMPTDIQSTQATYPYSSYLPTTDSVTMPQQTQSQQQTSTLPNVTISRPTDYTKPQDPNLSPQVQKI